VRGLIISNELLDAMPVHRLRWDAAQKKWFEWGVAVENDKFVWKKLPDDERFTAKDFCLDLGENSSEATPQLFNILPDGFTTELCPLASQWWTQAARHLKAGKLAAFDYGLTGDQFFTPERHAGTLRAYRNHRQSNDLLNFPGEQDITAQVNFSSLIRAGESEGLPTEYFNTQARFLTNLAQNISRRDPQFGEWITARSRAFQTLTHPEHLGRSFRVLVQSR
jgi:SAM-dependent MidA family methyltransferase